MMKAATSLMSCPDSLSFQAGISAPVGGLRPFVMVSIRNAGLSFSASETPGSVTIGLSAGPIPPSRLEPWQVVQFCPYTLWPLLGSPGSAVVPVAADPPALGEGELSARVDM